MGTVSSNRHALPHWITPRGGGQCPFIFTGGPSMFGTIARLMYRRRWYVVGIWVVAFIVAGIGAANVSSVLGPGDFTQKGSDSAKAAQRSEEHTSELQSR